MNVSPGSLANENLLEMIRDPINLGSWKDNSRLYEVVILKIKSWLFAIPALLVTLG